MAAFARIASFLTEPRAALAALRPPKRARPLFAIIGINDATETTDYLMPHGILRRADVADIFAVATRPGPVQLFPALKVEPDATVAEFDARHPQGADYVIVPAMSRDDDPAPLEWIRSQAAKAHRHCRPRRRDHDRHYRIDADDVDHDRGHCGSRHGRSGGKRSGPRHLGCRHDSSAFRLTRPFATTVLGNVLSFWSRDHFGIALRPGMDEVSLALVADAWSRTYRSRARTVANSAAAITTRNGMRIVPDTVAAGWSGKPLPVAINDRRPPAKALDETLQAIETRYGRRTADVVAMQLEYPRQPASR